MMQQSDVDSVRQSPSVIPTRGTPSESSHSRLDRRRWGKRLFDLVCAFSGLVVLMPLLIGVAIVMCLVQGRPILFRQTRIGRDGVPFQLYKFRSMSNRPDQDGPQVTAAGDQRVTRLGYWLRALKIDEFPQLWNVLRGEMSLVGPRPEVPAFVQLYDEQQRQVLRLVPGLTDPNIVRYMDESDQLAAADDPHRHYVETIMPDKIRTNLRYAESATFFSDLRLILKSVLGAVSRSSQS